MSLSVIGCSLFYFICLYFNLVLYVNSVNTKGVRNRKMEV